MPTGAEDDIAFFVFKRSPQSDMIVLQAVQWFNNYQPAPDTEGEMADTTGGSETDWFSNPNLQLVLMIIFEISKLPAPSRPWYQNSEPNSRKMPSYFLPKEGSASVKTHRNRKSFRELTEECYSGFNALNSFCRPAWGCRTVWQIRR